MYSNSQTENFCFNLPRSRIARKLNKKEYGVKMMPAFGLDTAQVSFYVSSSAENVTNCNKL